MQRGDHRAGDTGGIGVGDARGAQPRCGRVDPRGEHLVRGRAQGLVAAGDLTGDRADRTDIDVVAVLEHVRCAMEEGTHRVGRVARLVGDHFEQLLVDGARLGHRRRRQVGLAAGEEVVERPDRCTAVGRDVL